MASGGILALLNDPNRPHDTKPVHNPTAEECRRQWKEQRAFESEIRQLVDEALDTRQAKHLQGEREKNERALSQHIDDFFAVELADTIETALPPEPLRKQYLAEFRVFETFCRENGVGSLPAAPETVFYYCVHDMQPQKVKERLAALRFVHDVSRKWFPEAYARAAEKWSQEVKPHSSGDSAAKPNGNGAVH